MKNITYKISYINNGKKEEFGGFTYDGITIWCGNKGGIRTNNYRARQIKKMLEARGFDCVHVNKCQSNGKEENKKCLNFVNFLHKYGLNEYYNTDLS